MSQPLRFVLIWCAALLVVLALVAGLNLAVDPYDVFGSPRHAGFNLIKPGAKNHTALAKTYQVERYHPATVILGTSRAYIGLNADSPAWPAAMRPVYNSAIPAYQVTANVYRTLQEVQATGQLKHALIVLDFQGFLLPDPVLARDDDQRRLLRLDDGTPNPDRARQTFDDAFLALFTMGALLDSIDTLLSQGAGPGSDRVLNLMPDGTASEADFANAARADGMYELFSQKAELETDRSTAVAATMANWHGPMPNLATLDQILRFAQAHGIAVTLALAPSHANTLEAYWTRGVWPRIEQLKLELATLAAKYQRPGSPPVTFWDFLDYSQYTTEPVPPPGDRRTQTRWFWEPTHFKKALGEMILRRMFDPNEPSPSDLGAALTPDTVAAHNAAIRAQRQAYACRAAAPPGCGAN